jgi:acyl-CoA synthetase (AMP-forming)/AMP-acid ligase II
VLAIVDNSTYAIEFKRVVHAGYWDGYLYITDRKKDMIIGGDSNLYPYEIEEVICRHPAVFEIGVIDVPDNKWGAVKALVVTHPGASTTEPEIIKRELRKHYGAGRPPRV